MNTDNTGDEYDEVYEDSWLKYISSKITHEEIFRINERIKEEEQSLDLGVFE